MCKRFYVEVSGLGEDGVERLVDAGIKKTSILVIDDKNKLQPLINAIYAATGVTFEQICSPERSRKVMVARLIYVHHATIAGQDSLRIMEELNKDKAMFNWYQNHYETSMTYDRSFKRPADQVTAILEQDPEWIPTRLEQIRKERKRRRKMKKKKKAKKQELKPEEIAAIVERRQLKIDFK